MGRGNSVACRNGLATIAAAFAGGLLAIPAIGQEVEFRQVPAIFFPSFARSDERLVHEIEPFIVFPLRWPLSVRLERDVSITFHEVETVLAAGSLLPKVAIRRRGEEEVWRWAYCVRSRNTERSEGMAVILQQLDELQQNLNDGQICVEDGDVDGSLDRAIALGEGSQVVEMGSITPLPFAELRGEIIGVPEDMAFISLETVRSNYLKLNFNILQADSFRQFDRLQSGNFSTSADHVIALGEGNPGTAEILGIDIQVLEWSREDNTARIRWTVPEPNAAFVVVPDVLRYSYGR